MYTHLCGFLVCDDYVSPFMSAMREMVALMDLKVGYGHMAYGYGIEM